MARVTVNSFFEDLLNGIAGLVFRRMPGGDLASTPRSRMIKSTPGNKSSRTDVRDEARFAKWAAREYPIYAELAAGRPMVSAYNVALSDCFHPPVIHRILRRDGRILVQASDNVMVKEVKVSVRDGQGNLLDWGNAVRLEGDWWVYSPRVQGSRITIQAWDIPGNMTRLDLK